MKFALNHPWKFEKCYLAFLSGLAQTLVTLLIEGTCFTLIMANNTPQKVIASFIILIIITQFDEFLYQSFADQRYREIFTKISETPFLVVQ